MSNLPGDVNDAITELNKYPNIMTIIPEQKFRDRVARKYPNGPELLPGEVHDIYTALLFSKIVPHSGNAASPESMLVTINHCLPLLSLTTQENQKMADKLLQLRSTAFWDTFSEIVVTTVVKQSMNGSRIEMEYKFEKARGNHSKDSDIALLDSAGSPLALLDVYTPKYKDNFNPTIENASTFISNKYNSKFKNYCIANPSEKVFVVVSVIENETCILPYLLDVLSGKIGNLSANLSACTNLTYGQLCTFRCRDPQSKLLEMVTLAKYIKI